MSLTPPPSPKSGGADDIAQKSPHERSPQQKKIKHDTDTNDSKCYGDNVVEVFSNIGKVKAADYGLAVRRNSKLKRGEADDADQNLPRVKGCLNEFVLSSSSKFE